ncbi:MAG: PRC-barrel domain-containing protein [Thaumarchaeota archaeon]|nr:PRC-barrel domain-containing protein [Nitrososphaerota archaeon]
MPSSHLFTREEVVGKTVIDSTGQTTGKVKDLAFSLDGRVVLVVDKKDGTEMQVPLSRVVGISEFVVTGSESPLEPASMGYSSTAYAGGQPCKFCGHALSPSSVYCPSCGKSQR